MIVGDPRPPHVAMLVRNPFTHDTRVEKEAATLVDAGYRVTVVADAAPGLPHREDRNGVAVRRVARGRRRVPGLSFLSHELRLIGVLQRLRADVLHAHDSNALIPVAVAAARKKPYVYDAHDLWLHRPRRMRSRLYHAAQNAWFGLVERILVPRAAAVLTVSPPIAEHLRRVYRLRSVDLVPNYPALEPSDSAARELRSLPGMESVPATVPIVLYVGGLMAGRGIEGLVDAMAAVPTAHLVLLGAGHLAGDLTDRAARRGVSDRVHVLGPVPSDDVVAYAASADVGVSPIVPSCLNYRYSLPNKLFQYMAAGVPVVASDFPQVREVVLAASAGQVVDTERPEEMAGAIRAALADPAGSREMGRRGRAAVLDRLNWSTSAATLLEVYRRITRA
jgi:glycosyltransferase involved in cell wall biosynthesis